MTPHHFLTEPTTIQTFSQSTSSATRTTSAAGAAAGFHSNLNNLNTVVVRRSTCLIHIGKTGGSLLSCIFKVFRKACLSDTLWNRTTGSTAALSQNVQRGNYAHMIADKCADDTDSFLVPTRNPIDRFSSLFYYEQQFMLQRDTQMALYQNCSYYRLDQFAVQGLGGVPLTTTTSRRIPENVYGMTCSQRAWATVLGTAGFLEHGWFNYEYYYTEIIQPHRHIIQHSKNNTLSSYSLPIFVLRNEYFGQDWDNIQQLLLSSPDTNANNTTTTILATPGNVLFREKVRTSQHSEHANSPEILLSPEGLENLCFALCWEIQYYKQLLQQGVNISPEQYEESMTGLQRHCPNESFQVRTCPTESFPKFPRYLLPEQFRRPGKQHLPHLWQD